MAIGAIQYYASGVPRIVNAICDMSLVYGLADNTTEIDLAVVQRVIADRMASGVSPFATDARPDDPAVVAEITVMVREAMELRAVPMEAGKPSSVIEVDAEPTLAAPPANRQANGHGAQPGGQESYPRLEVDHAASGYPELRADALSFSEYRQGWKRGAEEQTRPSWFRRTFKGTS
jgi:hypothetical protein